ncbi:chromosomal replication initiator protein DnaA [Lacticaseibacillus pabuli]|uniref:Chromosomal replication initiator protein DnaA n=1 Tax=Lacticaseibacillus pabuli TaxID=3025672 RepID=A0ABY7WRD0_9LACO|nr:chromosomal replication initiator protein DnaA [Lacticaseibacillus sp. KACC 23028]WDF82666.1 chromosomal replication initiator protein DnaA [Lacticaseibacillus sp. KACC 23028]
MSEMNDLWGQLVETFREKLSQVGFTTWIETAKPVSLNDGVLTIQVPDKLHRDYWQKNLATQVVTGAYAFDGTEISPVIVVAGENQPAAAAEPEFEEPNKPVPTYQVKSNLNSRYTFDEFVVGQGNQMAHAAALAVSDEPGTLYNPLFIYGGVGLGKTHLMQAIGHQILETSKTPKNVRYVTTENFTNDMINAIRTNKQEEFRQSYRQVDLLLVDDIQFLANKTETQNEFFNTFNTLFDNKKQIVMTSDRLPNEIPKLQDRLVSRFKWGLSVDITPPDLETRIAILSNKASDEDLQVPKDALNYIAGQIDSNVRELEGALLRVKAFASMKKEPITTRLVADALKSLNLSGKDAQLTIGEIQEVVAKYYNVSVADLKGRKRVKQIVMPRQIAMYLARELTENSLPRIGQEFGGKDHTTVIHACDKISNEVKADSDLKAAIVDLKNKLRNRG